MVYLRMCRPFQSHKMSPTASPYWTHDICCAEGRDTECSSETKSSVGITQEVCGQEDKRRQAGEAVMKVGALADEKRAYYHELLEMRRTEHQQKLEVLELKHSYYTAKLQKLKEE